MKRGSTKYKNISLTSKQEGDLEQLLKITDDDELKKLLGINVPNSTTADINTLRIMWKKEKNRIAAKKSREKKANLMIELEKKELQLSNEIETLKRFIYEYDNVIESLLRYIKYTLNADWSKTSENVQNKLGPSKLQDSGRDMSGRDVYRKLVCCLEYFYHIRNNENYILPCVNNSMANRQDASNRLIDEIIYSIKNTSCFVDKK